MEYRFDYNDDEYEIAEFTDANFDVDLFFRKLAIRIVVVAAFVVAVMGTLITFSSNAAQASAKTKKNGGAVILSASNSQPKATNVPETAVPTVPPVTDSEKLIVVDAGHGGFDPGTEGVSTGVFESELNLAIAKKLERILSQNGYTVIMTRTDENAIGAGKEDDMTARDTIIQNSGANMFVSIHQNAYDGEEPCGAEVYYHPTMQSSKQFAEYVERELAAIPGCKPSRGVKEYGNRVTKFLKYSILVECGFISNPDEEKLLMTDSYQEQIANAIYTGIQKYCDAGLAK